MKGLIDSELECSPSSEWVNTSGAVLVVEDCEPLLFYLNSALLTLGFEEQHLAANLAEAEAVWALHKHEIRQIVLNYELPDGFGLEFAARVQVENPDLNIVITTGYDLATVKEECKQIKGLQFLQKPFRLGELQKTLAASTVV